MEAIVHDEVQELVTHTSTLGIKLMQCLAQLVTLMDNSVREWKILRVAETDLVYNNKIKQRHPLWNYKYPPNHPLVL